MTYLMLFFLIASLQSRESRICDDDCRKKANQATRTLAQKPFVPTAKIQPVNSNMAKNPTNTTSLNHLKVIGYLEKLKADLKTKDALPVFSSSRTLHPNDKDQDSIPQLRKILNTLGYLKEASDSPFFDVELEDAVKAFQAKHCIESDGIIGSTTIDRLNWSIDKRLKLIDESIEKIKSLVFTDRTVIANIPTYTLSAFEKENPKLHMKIIVGQNKRQTPLMTSYIDGVEFNPVWVVPKTILFEDKLPKMQHDPNFFEKNKLKVIDHDNEEVDPQTIEWNDYDSHNFPYMLKQEPGDKNALGRLKFNLRNDDLIYFHDTPNKELFKKSSRALSSGCVRLEKPGLFATWLLNKDKDQIKEEIQDNETKTEKLKKNITVHIAYLPVWIEEEGDILWGDDPYNLEQNAFN